MRRIIPALIVLFLIAKPVYGGFVVSVGSVELKPFEEKTVCGMCVYSTLPEGNIGHAHIEYSENLEKFIVKIEPNYFELEPIECPSEPGARRECIDVECGDPDSKSAKATCTVFKGPFELSFNPQRQEHRGAVRALTKVGAATIIEPTDFYVYYTPFNAWYFVLGILIVLIGVGFVAYKIYKKFKIRPRKKKR